MPKLKHFQFLPFLDAIVRKNYYLFVHYLFPVSLTRWKLTLRLPLVSLLIIVTHLHLKQNEIITAFFVDYSPSIESFLEYLKINEKFSKTFIISRKEN